MKLNIIMLAVLACLLIIVTSCSRKADDYRSFLQGRELIYPGVISNVQILPGKNRLALLWNPSSDLSVKKYIVYWNNYRDSAVQMAAGEKTTDTVKCMINNLSEYAYTFFIYSFDSLGNKSVPTEIDNAAVYGTIYEGSLHNRFPDGTTPSVVNGDGSVTLRFLTPDTINITTDIQYTTTANLVNHVYLKPDSSTITLYNYKPGTAIQYRSSYIPVKRSLDTFYTVQYSVFPPVLQDVTNTYFQNAGSPMVASAMNGSRWGNLQAWTVNDAVKNHGGYGGFDNAPGYGTISIEYWGTPQIVNGKVYQTFTLPAGKYTFIATIQNIDYTLQSVYMLVAAGNTVPDITSYTASLANKKLTDNSMNGTDQSISFTLTQATQVSAGFIATMTSGNQGIRIKAVRLKYLPL